MVGELGLLMEGHMADLLQVALDILDINSKYSADALFYAQH